MACAVIQNFAMYIGAISVLSEVKWMWFIITLAGLAGVLLHLSKVFKSAADAKGGAAAELFSMHLPQPQALCCCVHFFLAWDTITKPCNLLCSQTWTGRMREC